MMDYQKAIKYLRSLDESRMEFRLQTTKDLLEKLEFRFDKLIVHVAGTNGKGSCAKTISMILQQKYQTVGLYTSPEILDFKERITINEQLISGQEFADLTAKIRKIIDSGVNATFFEATTALALKHFQNKKVDAIVLEAGLGGRLDATNAVDGDLCIITSIAFDHMIYLGDTIEKIAVEKAGIIKKRKPTVSCVKGEAAKIIQKRADELKSPLSLIARDFHIIGLRSDFDGTRFKLQIGDEILDLESPMSGDIQGENISAAVVAAKILGIPDAWIMEGVKKSIWPARMQTMSKNPRIIVDCAHNPEGVEKAYAFARENTHGRLYVVCAFSKDKDWQKMIEILSKAETLIVTSYQKQRSLDPKTITQKGGCILYEDPIKAFEYARGLLNPKDTLLILGSTYLAKRFFEHYVIKP